MQGRERPTLQKADVSLTESSKSLIAWGKQGEISLLLQQISQTSCLNQRQKDPATIKSSILGIDVNSHYLYCTNRLFFKITIILIDVI